MRNWSESDGVTICLDSLRERAPLLIPRCRLRYKEYPRITPPAIPENHQLILFRSPVTP